MIITATKPPSDVLNRTGSSEGFVFFNFCKEITQMILQDSKEQLWPRGGFIYYNLGHVVEEYWTLIKLNIFDDHREATCAICFKVTDSMKSGTADYIRMT